MNKALRYLGLAAKAGRTVVGAEECEKHLRQHRGGLLLAASDASGNTVAAAHRLCAGGGAVFFPAPYTKDELGRALGKAKPVALAYIGDEGLANAFAKAAESDREQEERV